MLMRLLYNICIAKDSAPQPKLAIWVLLCFVAEPKSEVFFRVHTLFRALAYTLYCHRWLEHFCSAQNCSSMPPGFSAVFTLIYEDCGFGGVRRGR
jgi:hypothetical protein